MSSQSVSRKRAAAGAINPQLGPVPNIAAAPNSGSQLTNDQFLQWGQNPANAFPNATNSYAGPVGVGATAPSLPPAAAAQNNAASSTPILPASNQLARRQPINQASVSRNRGYELPSTNEAEAGHSGNQNAPGWGESLVRLYERAAVAKKDAQEKRKQIPPFVQKLSRFVYLLFFFFFFFF